MPGTAQAKAQVELAQLEYELPRLTHRWTHLSRERGGIGLRGGGGEQQIEIDRRKIRQRLARLRRLLAEYQKQAAIRRERRESLLRVSLVGYTNVGKSTLMRLLSKAPVLVENRLFATLDTTSRKIVLDGLPILLSDTVGFIRKLPPNLLEAFHTTLEEVREADPPPPRRRRQLPKLPPANPHRRAHPRENRRWQHPHPHRHE
jgi:GTP-binding protein HflX